MGYSDTKEKELGVRLSSALKSKAQEYFDKATKATKLNRDEMSEETLKQNRAMHMTIALALIETAKAITEVVSDG